MGPKPRVTERDFFRQPLLEQINLKHPLGKRCASTVVDGGRRMVWR